MVVESLRSIYENLIVEKIYTKFSPGAHTPIYDHGASLHDNLTQNKTQRRSQANKL